MYIKEVLPTHAWNNSIQNKDENIWERVQGDRPDTSHTHFG